VRFLFVVGCIFAFVASFASSATADTADQIHFTIISNTAVTFDWIGTADRIYYGTSHGSLNNTVVAVHPPFLPVTSPWHSNPGPFWEAKLTGLQQNTVYYYRVGDFGQVETFRSPPVPGASSFRVCAISDMHRSSAECTTMFNQVAGFNPNLVITTGDTTGGDSEGQTSVDIRFHEAMVWSQSAAWMPIWGNHDWEDGPTRDDLRSYKGRFDIPNPQTASGSPAPGCCSEDWGWFDYGNTRFISWPERYNDSTTWQNWKTAAAPVFAAAQNDSNIDFIITFGHQSAYTSTLNRYPGSTTLQNILNGLHNSYSKYKLDLSGHNHNYERYQISNGMTYIIDSTAGAYYREWDPYAIPKPSNCAYRAIHYGIVVLDIYDTGIRGRFVCSVNSQQSDCIPIEEAVCGEPNAVIDTFIIGTPLPEDTTSPTPDPMTWSSPPAAASPYSITMTASTATDSSGVEYFFRNVTDPYHDIGWQDSPIYTDTSLTPDANYEYQVKARDKSLNHNETTYSATAIARTPACNSQAVFFSDDFEDYEEISTKWDVLPSTRYVYISDLDSYTGTHSVQIEKTSSIEKQISTAGYSGIHLQYAYKVDSTDPYEAGEYLYAEWSVDGINWNILGRTQQTTWVLKDFVCDPNADDTPDFRVRFHTTADSGGEWAFVDSVKLYVSPIPGDIHIDGVVDFLDFAEFASHWDETGCTEPDWCGGANLDKTNDYIDFADLKVLAGYWLEGL
jgi:hypothetical protein